MKNNPLKDGVISENSAGLGTVTRKMIQDRAIESAAINGRASGEVIKGDLDQARQELTGLPETDAHEELVESLSEAQRWDPIGGSTGTKARVAPSEDEDEDGRSDNEKLVEEGVADAEYDHERQAAKEASKNGG